MTASANASEASEASEAIVAGVGFDVAHDSDGLLILTLRFPNGARSRLQLEGASLARLVEALGLESVHELVGRPFSQLAPHLPANTRS